MCKPNYTVFTSLLACISSDTAAKRTMHFAKKVAKFAPFRKKRTN